MSPFALAAAAAVVAAALAAPPHPARVRLLRRRTRTGAPVLRRRTTSRQGDAMLAGLPETIDLFRLAVGAGLTVPLAIEAVARRSPSAASQAIAAAARAETRLADALDDIPAAAGEALRPLTAALAASERYGAPLAAQLEGLADEARRAELRRAEARARRVPVLLLFPLVLCILPAFALLTVAPLLAGALRTLRL